MAGAFSSSALHASLSVPTLCCCCSVAHPSSPAPSSSFRPLVSALPGPAKLFQARSTIWSRPSRNHHPSRILALVVDPSDSAQESADKFVERMEKAWLISKQPRPVSCISCKAEGHIECAWCKGTGFFILGDNMLCEVPSRNTTCLICLGQGSVECKDCKGTGYRARWLGNPPSNNNGSKESSHS